MTILHFNRGRCICAWRGGGKAKNDRGRGNGPSNTQDGIGAEALRSDWIGWVSHRLNIRVPLD